MQVTSTNGVLPPAINRTQPAKHTVEPLTAANDEQKKTLSQPTSDELLKPVASSRKAAVIQQLSSADLKLVRQLQHRDREVRAHEQAHANAGGAYTGAPNYQFTRGPDGQQYASSGHVSVDSSAIVGDPRATLQKAQQLKRAALAPAQPSQQDRRVAAKAGQLAIEARTELTALLLKAQKIGANPAPGSTIDTFA
ncbi:hypothetical protein A9Q89_01690 [Gammaproteobacteria bacterium 53_120_T64]|nr:hypothetical protein A9Q89_01690 [Gammaproteobacteria bacterium 53_120_T64]